MEVVKASLLSLLLLAVVYSPLERMWPARRQQLLRPGLGTDFLFLFGQHLLFSVLALGALTVVAGWLRGLTPAAPGELFAQQPRWLQLVEVVVLGDFCVYWFHRACHHFDVLWRFHAVHHSSTTLDWVAAHREHPVDGFLTQLAVNLPAIALGFPVEGLAGLAVFRGLWAIFIHSNTRLPLGPLRYLLGAPELHHWHHAKAPARVANYGNLSPWCDLLFGTFHLPEEEAEESWALGVPEALPTTWWGLLAAPFRPASGNTLRGAVTSAAVTLGLLVAVLALDARASDGGVWPRLGSLQDDSYLPATKSFGELPSTHSLSGLGLRSPTPAPDAGHRDGG